MLEIILRLEQPADYRETEELTREAFFNHFAPGCDEHYLVHTMRTCPAFVPELDVVAVHEGRIVGNIMYMKSVIKSDDGKEHQVLSLGPVSVLPEYQGRGVGGKLIGHTRQLAAEMGYCAILLCGDPDYYERQGYVPAEQLFIRTEDDMYIAALQVCVLDQESMACVRGRYVEHPIYHVDQSAAAAFDQSFPPKERVTGTPSQLRFDEIVAMRKNAL